MNFKDINSKTISFYNLSSIKELFDAENIADYCSYTDNLQIELSEQLCRIKNIDIELKFNHNDKYYQNLKETYIKLLQHSAFDNHRNLTAQFKKICLNFGELIEIRENTFKNCIEYQEKLIKSFESEIDRSFIHMQSFYYYMNKQKISKYYIKSKLDILYHEITNNIESIIDKYINDLSTFIDNSLLDYTIKIVELIEEITIYLTKDETIL